MINDECSVLNAELKNNSYFITYNSELSVTAVLAANLFRATQTEEKLRRENIQGKTKANTTRFEVGKKVRQTIEELGGTMPEDLPHPMRI